MPACSQFCMSYLLLRMVNLHAYAMHCNCNMGAAQLPSLSIRSGLSYLKAALASAKQPSCSCCKANLQLPQAASQGESCVQDFKENIEDNAKDTAEAREKGFQAPNPGEDDKQPTEEYRSTKLGKSSQKYAPKSEYMSEYMPYSGPSYFGCYRLDHHMPTSSCLCRVLCR